MAVREAPSARDLEVLGNGKEGRSTEHRPEYKKYMQVLLSAPPLECSEVETGKEHLGIGRESRPETSTHEIDQLAP